MKSRQDRGDDNVANEALKPVTDMQLKKDSPNKLVTAIQAIEDRADRCYENLPLYAIPKGKASWGVLVYLVLRTEAEREKHGYGNYDVVLINLSRWGTLVLRWIQQQGNPEKHDPQKYSWTNNLARSVGEAVSIAGGYDVFLTSFPMWHQNRLLGELASESESTVRFIAVAPLAARRVSAYQKGFKPMTAPTSDQGLVLTAEQDRERNRVLQQCFYAGDLAITYPEPSALYQSLFSAYFERLIASFRRSDAVDVGPYTVGELKRGYAALTTILSVHEDLCFRFGARHGYPVNSCVMMRTPAEWVKLISRLSGLGETEGGRNGGRFDTTRQILGLACSSIRICRRRPARGCAAVSAPLQS